MKRLAMLAALAGVLAVATPANGQNDCKVICSPVFVHQSSVIITSFLGDKPEGVKSDTEFLARVTTAFGTQWAPLFLVALVQWTPFADISEGESGKANPPVFVYGPGFHTLGGASALLNIGSAANYFSLDLLPLGVYAPGCGDCGDESLYTHRLALEADAFLHIGKLLDPNNRAPFLNAWSIHVILDYLTDAFGRVTIPKDLLEDPDEKQGYKRWVLIIGITHPIAPIPTS